jgi:2-(1,2-epoxy-1,2-dihydrophenyl)acetyl-CoA isomerase
MTATDTNSGTVDSNTAEGICVLTLNFPERRNALPIPMRVRLLSVLKAALDDPACKVIVLTGAGGNFSAGGDVNSMGGVGAIEGRSRVMFVNQIVRCIIQGPKPVIAAVEGICVAAGMSLAVACDIVVAARNAKFGCAFNKVGLMPDMGAGWVLPQRMGVGRARLLMLTGRMIDGDTALQLGLVEQISEAGKSLADALEIAREIGTRAPLANAFCKSMLGRAPLSLDAYLQAEADAQGLLFGSRDFLEGQSAFLNKRAATFNAD